MTRKTIWNKSDRPLVQILDADHSAGYTSFIAHTGGYDLTRPICHCEEAVGQRGNLQIDFEIASPPCGSQ
jgi:hypothetical protein